jgi:long-chain acyl-CoA synthetase
VGITSTLRRTAQVRGKATASYFQGRRRTWSEFLDRVTRIAGGMRTLGVKPGDRVAMLALSSDRYMELFAAIPWAGGVVVPLNLRWSQPELADSLQDSGAILLFVDAAMLDMGKRLAAEIGPGLTLVSLADGPLDGLPDYEDLVRTNDPAPDAGRSGEDLYGIFYTGGTTGRSKGVMLSHKNSLAGCMTAYAEGYYREDAVCLVACPMFHAAGSWPLVALFGSGGGAYILPAFDAKGALTMIETEGCSEGLLVPTMIQMIIEHPDFSKTDTSSIRQIVYGASPITEALLDRALEALPHVQFIQAYGQTELSPLCTNLHHEHLVGEARRKGRHRSAGRAVYGVEVRIVDEDDRDVKQGEVGQILCRGDNVMQGYWQRPEETAAALKGGWMHTGDGGWMDEDGFVYVVDRVKDMIVSGAENVYSVEVENAIARHPAVQSVAVIGIPHEKWGEQVHAIVILWQGASASEDEIVAHCRTLIAGYKVPRSVEFRTEALPLSGAGKVLKRELRKPYWAGKDRMVN